MDITEEHSFTYVKAQRTLTSKREKACKKPEGEGLCSKTVSPSNIRRNTYKISSTSLPKHKLNKKDTNPYTNWTKKCS